MTLGIVGRVGRRAAGTAPYTCYTRCIHRQNHIDMQLAYCFSMFFCAFAACSHTCLRSCSRWACRAPCIAAVKESPSLSRQRMVFKTLSGHSACECWWCRSNKGVCSGSIAVLPLILLSPLQQFWASYAPTWVKESHAFNVVNSWEEFFLQVRSTLISTFPTDSYNQWSKRMGNLMMVYHNLYIPG